MINEIKIRKEVRPIATQNYVLTVQERKGGITLGKIHRHFCQQDYKSNSEYNSQNSGIIYKYAKGKACIKDTKLINRIEEELPGTKRLLNHPLWLILETPLADLDRIYEYMHQLIPPIQAQLFKQDSETKIYHRKNWQGTEPLLRISMQNNFDALACLLMLMREMELLKRWHSYIEAKWCVHNLLLRLAYFEPIFKINDNLYELIYIHFIDKNNPLPDKYRKLEFIIDYSTPPFIGSVYYSNDHISGILWNAQKYGIEEENKHDCLKFLFWVYTFGHTKIHKALHPAYSIENAAGIIEKLMSAYGATNTRRHLPLMPLFD